MRVLISGSTGFIGTALVKRLLELGHEPVRLVRSTSPGDVPSVRWDPAAETIDESALEDIDAVVHLAGESIASSKWTDEQKARIMDSRVKGTRTLAKAMAAAENPPSIFLSGSAIGYYGDTGDQRITQESLAADDFAAVVTVEWEKEAAPIATDRTRLAYLRTGIVLDPSGGALKEQLPFFKLGIGGRIGDLGRPIPHLGVVGGRVAYPLGPRFYGEEKRPDRIMQLEGGSVAILGQRHLHRRLLVPLAFDVQLGPPDGVDDAVQAPVAEGGAAALGHVSDGGDLAVHHHGNGEKRIQLLADHERVELVGDRQG